MVDRGNPGRTGSYLRQPGGFSSFVPTKLPYDPPLALDEETLYLLSVADQAIGRLDAAAGILPNPELFVGMYVAKEAVLSSQIEGVTQASLAEVLEYNARGESRRGRRDIDEVGNYVTAMNYGLERVNALPLSARLLREIHSLLLRQVRGDDMRPGEFRTTQNWIGAPGATLATATFVPPPPGEMMEAIGDLERYMHDDTPVPVLIKTGLIHCQFETIHPFLDGNGRMGRLLAVFYLCNRGVLRRPLLYLSQFFQANKDEYYQRLQAVRDFADVEGWVKFFLTATWKVSEAAASTAHSILLLRETHRNLIQDSPSASSPRALDLLDNLFKAPYMTVTGVAGEMEVSYPTANSLVSSLVRLGILEEVTGRGRNRIFRYTPYLDLMDRGLDVERPEENRKEGRQIPMLQT